MDYLVELVVSEDDVCVPLVVKRTHVNYLQAFQLVDKGAFRRLLMYLRPSLLDTDIPHRTKLRAVILERATAVEERMKEKLQVSISFFQSLCVHLHITIEDTWSGVFHLRYVDFGHRRPFHLGHCPLHRLSRRTPIRLVPQSGATCVRSL